MLMQIQRLCWRIRRLADSSVRIIMYFSRTCCLVDCIKNITSYEKPEVNVWADLWHWLDKSEMGILTWEVVYFPAVQSCYQLLCVCDRLWGTLRKKVPSSLEEREGTFAAIEITFFSPISVTQCDTEINPEKCDDVWEKRADSYFYVW